MFRHRILVVGAPASGRGWMAGRISTLTGIPLRLDDGELDEREWLRLADTVPRVEALQPRAELVVLMVTPVWLRWLRLLRRAAGAPRLVGPGLLARLRATRRWDRDTLPAVLPLLERGPGRLIKVRSSEHVRTVLESVFGLVP